MAVQHSTHAPIANDVPDAYGFLRRALARLGCGDLPGESAVQEMAAEFEIEDAALWNILPGSCDYHGVTALVAPIVSALSTRSPSVISNRVRRQFFALASRHREASAAREACVDRLVSAFVAAGIPPLLLKGAALAHLIYPSPASRPMLDIDVMVDRRHLDTAIAEARKLGYVFADHHPSRFVGDGHHIPGAEIVHAGFHVFLEIHTDTMSANQPHRLDVSRLSAKPQPVRRGSGPTALALGHTDMLRHLARHAFEPARQVRLMHLYDMWRYQAIFREQIDWRELHSQFPFVPVVLDLVSLVFSSAPAGEAAGGSLGARPSPAGLGQGMVPLSDIAASHMPASAKIAAMFNPPEWWLRGFYGVPLDRSLFLCKTVKHPATLARWLFQRLAAASGLRGTRRSGETQP